MMMMMVLMIMMTFMMMIIVQWCYCEMVSFKKKDSLKKNMEWGQPPPHLENARIFLMNPSLINID